MPRELRWEIDFDEWAALAARDPATFERRRARVVAAFVDRLPADRQLRLRRLQWRIDRARERAANPVAACVRIYQMMWDSLAGEDGLLQVLQNPSAVRRAPRRVARVLPLRPRP